MKKSMMIAVAGLGLLLAGCATQSPYVGTWKGQEDPGDEEIVLTLTEEGGMLFEGEGDEVFVGSWEVSDEGKVELTAEGEDEKAVVTLVDDVLVLSVGNESVKFTRQKD